VFEEFGHKRGMGNNLNNIGLVYQDKGDYEKAEKYLEKSLSIKKEIGIGAEHILETTIYLYLSLKKLSKEYDEKEIHRLIKESGYIEFTINYNLYQLLEEKSYLKTAYNQIQEKADNLESDVAAKFLSYPIPKAIVEEWEKVTTDKN
jgi:tetratricopeptide (TPR) repeat protein